MTAIFFKLLGKYSTYTFASCKIIIQTNNIITFI